MRAGLLSRRAGFRDGVRTATHLRVGAPDSSAAGPVRRARRRRARHPRALAPDSDHAPALPGLAPGIAGRNVVPLSAQSAARRCSGQRGPLRGQQRRTWPRRCGATLKQGGGAGRVLPIPLFLFLSLPLALCLSLSLPPRFLDPTDVETALAPRPSCAQAPSQAPSDPSCRLQRDGLRARAAVTLEAEPARRVGPCPGGRRFRLEGAHKPRPISRPQASRSRRLGPCPGGGSSSRSARCSQCFSCSVPPAAQRDSGCASGISLLLGAVIKYYRLIYNIKIVMMLAFRPERSAAV